MMAATRKPSSLNELCETTGLPRATAHRLATALEAHRILTRTPDGKWGSGPALPGQRSRLLDVAGPVMDRLLRQTGESIQLYELTGDTRTCIATREPTSGLHNIVPVGRQLPLTSGSAARIIVAYTDAPVAGASFTDKDVAAARANGFSESIEEREAGLSSVSVPVLNPSGIFIAALSISGSAERFGASPAKKYAPLLADAAREISRQL